MTSKKFLLQFELLFCVPDESDAAIMAVHSLMGKYPAVDARLFIGMLPLGNNVILW